MRLRLSVWPNAIFVLYILGLRLAGEKQPLHSAPYCLTPFTAYCDMAMSERRTLSMARVPDVSPPRSFPYCVVWTPIPVVSWLLPFIGHMGICTSTGRVLDFAASFYVSADAMAFGNPTR